MIPVNFLVCVCFILFLLGALTVLIRRNILIILMGLELMLNAASLLFITYSRVHANLSGHVFTLFIFVVAAVEVGLIIAIILNIFGLKKSLLTSSYSLMRK
jgi:NADH-quinone oxidoreductase subunit K